MWRSNAAGVGDEARENEDSDQSISEEDDGLDGEWARNAISLGDGENNKGKMQVLSQLELYRESCMEESISSQERRGIEDEVEPPIFNDGNSPSRYHGIASSTLSHSNKGLICLQDVASVSYSDEEFISDEEKTNPRTLRSVGENLAITWSDASRELKALVRSNKKPCYSSNHHDVFVKEKKSTKGGGSRRKPKAKFSFPCHSETSSDNIVVADEIGAAADEEMHDNAADSHLMIHDKHILPFEMGHKYDTRGHSMAEIISGFLERSDLQEESSELEIQKRIRGHAVLERNAPPLGDRVQEDNDLPDTLDSDASFESEDEENAQSVKPIISRTVADQFHEALRTVSEIDDTLHLSFHRPLCGGVYRKLQQVLQGEKERVADSLKNASAETAFKDEGMSILVRILSRSLEAKLIVCSCICVGYGKNLLRETRSMIIIFNPRMSNDADLEVGNLIRVLPPWKEVQVKDGEIILCSYFSHGQP